MLLLIKAFIFANFQEMTKVETNNMRASISSHKRKFNEQQLNVANSFGVQAYNASEKAHRIPLQETNRE